jgi:16S rRNA C967 or C1407 C5-methylase (RsmB/RsmF family)
MCPSAKALAAQRVNELREQLERLNAPSVRVHQCHSAEVRDLIYSRED